LSNKLIDQGVAAMRQDKLAEAEASFQAAYEIHNLPAAVDGLGCIALRRKDYPKAIEYFKAAFDMDSKYTRALGNLALAYELSGDRESAQATYKRAIYEDPADYRARGNFGGLLLDYGTARDIERARAELVKAYAIVPHPLIEQNLKEVE
jgi:tetratricopeptide (TPR) repeat protein